MNKLGEVLLQGCQAAGLSISGDQVAGFERYGQLLVEWNEKVNLTAITDPEGIALKHFVDSLLCSKYVDFEGDLNLLDVGTGAGFPGIPLKIYNEKLQVTLLDSLQKRVKFLQQVSLEVKLYGLVAIHGRAEELGQQSKHREQYDRVVSRAVARLAVLAEYCLPFVKVGGLFAALKGSSAGPEVEEGLYAVEQLGGKVKDVVEYSLPVLGDGRSLVVVEKVNPTPGKYPRKAGLPDKKPLLGGE
ncbi:MAG: 16S rRNA (guanine(527)-N(7))-methyltransferase RsmG [Clostridia bacterium]|nr:16S rRNA (guanine(527)-N(7))-methyltransferase RsmG [Clostridia bacterium]